MSGRTKNVARRISRPTGIAICAVATVSLAIPLATSALADTALFVGGVGEPMLYEPIMSQALGGQFTGTAPDGTQWVRKSIQWPAGAAPYYGSATLGDSVATGTDTLYNAITDGSITGPITVVGSSAGALVVDETLRRLAADPNGGPNKPLTFVVIADGSRQDAFKSGSSLFGSLAGYTYQTPAETKYNVTVVTYEYDGFADFPDRPWNLLADANAVAGILVEHNATYFADLDGLASTSTTNDVGGTTTRYLIPATTLPLVTLIPSLASQEDSLRQMIDTGYSRNDATTAAAADVVSTALKTTASDTTPAVAASDVSTPTTKTPARNALAKAFTKASARTERLVADVTAKLTGAKTSAGVTKAAASDTDSDSGSHATKPSTKAGKKSAGHSAGAPKSHAKADKS